MATTFQVRSEFFLALWLALAPISIDLIFDGHEHRHLFQLQYSKLYSVVEEIYLIYVSCLLDPIVI